MRNGTVARAVRGESRSRAVLIHLYVVIIGRHGARRLRSPEQLYDFAVPAPIP